MTLNKKLMLKLDGLAAKLDNESDIKAFNLINGTTGEQAYLRGTYVKEYYKMRREYKEKTKDGE